MVISTKTHPILTGKIANSKRTSRLQAWAAGDYHGHAEYKTESGKHVRVCFLHFPFCPPFATHALMHINIMHSEKCSKFVCFCWSWMKFAGPQLHAWFFFSSEPDQQSHDLTAVSHYSPRSTLEALLSLLPPRLRASHHPKDHPNPSGVAPVLWKSIMLKRTITSNRTKTGKKKKRNPVN